MKAPFFFTPYNVSEDHSDLGAISVFEPSMTDQSQRDECDINVLVERFGVVPSDMPQAVVLPQYGDYEGIFDFQSAMQVILDAKSAFMDLPAKVRTRFNNNPQEYLEFFANPDNYDEALRLGFVVPKPSSPEGGSPPEEDEGSNNPQD